MEPVADDGADVGFDFGIRADAHGGKHPEALLLQVFEDGAGLLDIVPVRPGAMGIVEDGSGTNQTAHLVQPALGVRLHPFQRGGREVDMAPGVAAKGPAGALQLRNNGLHRLALFLPVGFQFIIPHLGVRVGAVAQDALVAGEAQAAFGAEGGEVGMLPDELVQNGDGVQILGDDLVALGVQAVAPDQAVVTDDEFVGEAVLDHIIVVVHIVVGDDEGLFALGDVEGVPHHHRLAAGVGAFAPYVIDVHQHIAPVIYALENFVIFVHCDHPVIDAVGLTVAVKGQLRVGHDGVEEQMLHHAVPRYIGHAVHGAPVNGGGGDDVWLLLGFLRLLGRLRGGVGGLRLRSVIAGLGGRVRLGRAAAGGEGEGQ